MGICSFQRGDVCVFWCAHMQEVYADIYPSIHGRTLLEVGVVRKGINILLDYFVAELVLLLRREKQSCQVGNETSSKTRAMSVAGV